MATNIIPKYCYKCKTVKSRKDFYPNRTKKDGLCSECKTCVKNYNRTPEHKKIREKYRQSKKGKLTQKLYQQSETGKVVLRAAQKRYHQTEKYKAQQRAYQKAYRQTAKGKAYVKKRCQSEKYKIYYKYWRQTKRGKALIKAANKRYLQSEKGKAYQLARKFSGYLQAIGKVNNAVKKGKLPKASSLICHYCGNQAEQYHHWHGYGPQHQLDVIPVCLPCHRKNK